jgi:hypothetical protein
VQRHLECRLARVPIEVGVMKQCGELIDPFSQTLIRPKLAEQGDDFSQHEKSIPVSRVVAVLYEGQANLGKDLL